MNKYLIAVSVLSFSVSFSSQAAGKFHEVFLPKNNLHLMDRLDGPSNIDEALFNKISDRAIDYFQQYAGLHKATLTVVKRWDDATVNAYADQDSTGTKWEVDMFGGLARRPEVTPDGFALVVCHEIGHHFAGFAYYSDAQWAAAEGQADYFATHACARALWQDEAEENAKHRAKVNMTAKNRCDAVWSNQKDRDLCYRVADGGMSLANLLAAITSKPAPTYETPDTSVVSTTYEGHPDAQCRLDTYIAGGLCSQAFDFRVIPGRGNADGQDSIAAEKDSAQYTCFKSGGFKDGLRPACWFKTRL